MSWCQATRACLRFDSSFGERIRTTQSIQFVVIAQERPRDLQTPQLLTRQRQATTVRRLLSRERGCENYHLASVSLTTDSCGLASCRPASEGQYSVPPRRLTLSPVSVAVIYAALAIVWIWASDSFVLRLGLSAHATFLFATIKGTAFVVITSFVLYLLLRGHGGSDHPRCSRETHPRTTVPTGTTHGSSWTAGSQCIS